MPTTKRHTEKRSRIRKNKPTSKVIIVTKSKIPVKEALFPEKLEKVNKMLSMTEFIVKP